MDDVLLEVKSLQLDIGPVSILRNINLTLKHREAVGIIGESGSGKSMFARTLLGLLPHRALVRGGVRFEGMELNGLGERGFRSIRGKRIGFIPQDPVAAYNPTLSVGRQIDESNEFHAPGAGEKRQTPEEMLASVNIPDAARRAKQHPHELSGGMLQRGLIASAMSLKPSLLIADEPTTALDVTTQSGIVDLLIDMQARHGMALLLISHDLALVSNICTRIVVLLRGEIVEEGATDTIIHAPRHAYTQALLAATPTLSGASA